MLNRNDRQCEITHTELPELKHENRLPSTTHKNWGGYILIQALNVKTDHPDYLLNPYNPDDLQNRSMKNKMIADCKKNVRKGKIKNKYTNYPKTLTPLAANVITGKKSGLQKNSQKNQPKKQPQKQNRNGMF